MVKCIWLCLIYLNQLSNLGNTKTKICFKKMKIKFEDLPFLHVQVQRQASWEAVWAVEIRKSVEKLGTKSKTR